MKASKLLILALSGILVLSACAPAGGSKSAKGLNVVRTEAKPLSVSEAGDDADLAARLAEKINGFSFDMASRLGSDSFVFSPFSVYMALALLSSGAENAALAELRAALYPEGVTDAEFSSACGSLLALITDSYTYEGTDALKLEISSLLCTDSDYAPAKKVADIAARYFSGTLASADFSDPEAKELINAWAETATHGLIKNLISEPIDPETVMVLANSVYFSGKWEKPFSPDKSFDGVFHGLGGDTDARFMTLSANELSYAENDKYQAVRLSYHGGAYMTLYLPKDGADFGGTLEAMRSGGFDFSLRTGTVTIPKFSMDYTRDLEEPLRAMGMNAMFGGGLKPLVEKVDGDLYVSSAFQKARITVDEEGTEAAAVTVMTMVRTSLPMPTEPFEFTCDRPFMYTISRYAQGTETLLFIGSVGTL